MQPLAFRIEAKDCLLQCGCILQTAYDQSTSWRATKYLRCSCCKSHTKYKSCNASPSGELCLSPSDMSKLAKQQAGNKDSTAHQGWVSYIQRLMTKCICIDSCIKIIKDRMTYSGTWQEVHSDLPLLSRSSLPSMAPQALLSCWQACC